MLWTPNIDQIEFNEQINLAYELFRVLALSKYALENLREYLSEYLHRFNFNKLGELIGSIHQVSKTTLEYRKDEVFKKLTYIQPNPHVDTSHLNAQTINYITGTKTILLSNLRKYPLFYNRRNGYMIIDEDVFKKRSYKGFFFELYYNTRLRKTLSFNEYSTKVSLDVLEKMCFQSILKCLNKPKHARLLFDAASDNVPDAYYRHNKTLFLFEFKGYLFPDDLSSNPNFENIKKYIDQRFIESGKGKAKGIGQILNQLKQLKDNRYEFDEEFKNKLYSKKITIYPIIVHTEFHFSMPGISAYLEQVLQSKMGNDIKSHFYIKPITLINLEVLFDLVFRGGAFYNLQELFDRYVKILQGRREMYKKQPNIDTFIRSKRALMKFIVLFSYRN